jgi:hypothetical protein
MSVVFQDSNTNTARYPQPLQQLVWTEICEAIAWRVESDLNQKIKQMVSLRILFIHCRLNDVFWQCLLQFNSQPSDFQSAVEK